LDVASLGPVLLAVVDLVSVVVNTDRMSGVEDLGEVVQTTTSAAACLQESLILEIGKSTVLNDDVLVHLEPKSVKVRSECPWNSMLHQLKTFIVFFRSGCISNIECGQLSTFRNRGIEEAESDSPEESDDWIE